MHEKPKEQIISEKTTSDTPRAVSTSKNESKPRQETAMKPSDKPGPAVPKRKIDSSSTAKQGSKRQKLTGSKSEQPPKASEERKASSESKNTSDSKSDVPKPASQNAQPSKKEHIPDVKPKTKPAGKKPVLFTVVKHDSGTILPITARIEGASVTPRLNKAGLYEHTLKLTARSPFTVVKTTVFNEAGHAFDGKQVIVLQPAQPFRFLSLPLEVRARIYAIYFTSRLAPTAPVVLDGKRPQTKQPFAKTYADGSVYRVGLLSVNREIHQAATPFFYAAASPLRFEVAPALLEFVTCLSLPARALLRNIELKMLNRPMARAMLQVLADARGLRRLRIERGVASSETDVVKAARAFFLDAVMFLKVMREVRGGAEAAVEVLEFGPGAFLTNVKGADGQYRPWSKEMVAQFRELLVAKLQ